MLRTTTCRACSAKIMFIRTGGGKSIPVNADEVMYRECGGGKHKIVTPNGEVLSAELTDDPNKATGMGYISHFATCPAADTFRKQRKSDRKKAMT